MLSYFTARMRLFAPGTSRQVMEIPLTGRTGTYPPHSTEIVSPERVDIGRRRQIRSDAFPVTQLDYVRERQNDLLFMHA